MASRNRPSTQTDFSGISVDSRVLVLGLDGATFDLLGQWIQEGRLPTLERLIHEGAAGELRSIVPPLSSAAWASFATGKNPGKHGVFDFIFPSRNSYDVSIASSQTNASKAVWEVLSDCDKKVGIVGVPMTYPPREVNGFMISSFMTPSLKSNYTYPTSLKNELSSKGLPFRPTLRETHRSGNVGKFLKEVALSTQERVESVLYLLQEKEWDLFCFVFLSPDLLQHELWRMLDSRHPKHNPKEAQQYKGAICDFYAQLDRYIAEIIRTAGEDVLTILMSDHGFGPATHFFHVNNWLMGEGFLVRKRTIPSTMKYLLFRLGLTPMNSFRALSLLKLGWFRQHLRFGRKYGQARHLYFSFNDIDWSKTKAFSVGNWGQIYINSKGKRPGGIVEPGRECGNLKDSIVDRLLDLRDPNTGERIIERVVNAEDVYSGDGQDLGPDLIPLTKDFEYVCFGTSDFGSNRIIEPVYGMSGYHRTNGILIMSGKHIRPGLTLQGAEIIDLAPTILYATGVPVPSDMDGKVLTEAFTPDFLAYNTPTYSHVPSSRETYQESYSDEDEERVKERLRGMGYYG